MCLPLWCFWRESNPYPIKGRILSPLRLPIPPQKHLVGIDGFEPSNDRVKVCWLTTCRYPNTKGTDNLPHNCPCLFLHEFYSVPFSIIPSSKCYHFKYSIRRWRVPVQSVVRLLFYLPAICLSYMHGTHTSVMVFFKWWWISDIIICSSSHNMLTYYAMSINK